jgi:tetratricopeptide (TPR) repeat protein
MPWVSSAWFIPDAERWRNEEGYNPIVADALACASSKQDTDGRVTEEVFACVAPVLELDMSKSQRLRVLYIVCSRLAIEDPPTPALAPVDEALTLGIELDEIRARIDLLILRSYINRYITQIPDAVDDLRDCLEEFAELERRHELAPEDARKKLMALLRLAAFEFALGEIDASDTSLQEADVLLAQIGERLESQATLAWTRALVARWRGGYDEALTEGVAAVAHYQRLHDPETLSRVEGTVGDILLDLAAQSRVRGDETTSANYLVRAEQRIQHALQVAVAADAMASEAQARIIRARLQLLQGIPGDRRPLLEELANMGKEHQDMALVCKAYTGIGQECEAVFDYTAAKEWYRRAVSAVRESKTIVNAIWAQRALWRLEGEMDGGDSPPADQSQQN